MRKRNGQHEYNLYFQMELQEWLCFSWNASKFKCTKGREQGHVRDMEYTTYNNFSFFKFYRRCERIFWKWFCFVTLSKLCSYKNTFSFFFFFFSSWQRKGSFVTVVVMRRILSNYWQGIIITFSRFLRNTIRNCCYAQKLLEIKDIGCMITLLRWQNGLLYESKPLALGLG